VIEARREIPLNFLLVVVYGRSTQINGQSDSTTVSAGTRGGGLRGPVIACDTNLLTKPFVNGWKYCFCLLPYTYIIHWFNTLTPTFLVREVRPKVKPSFVQHWLINCFLFSFYCIDTFDLMRRLNARNRWETSSSITFTIPPTLIRIKSSSLISLEQKKGPSPHFASPNCLDHAYTLAH
jgi:hypothetical protein